MPPVGNQRSVPPKTISRISPSQNVGTDQNGSEVPVGILSNSSRAPGRPLAEPEPEGDRDDRRRTGEEEGRPEVLADQLGDRLVVDDELPRLP